MVTKLPNLQTDCIDALRRWRALNAVFVTPNNRLARHLATTLDQIVAGHCVEASLVLPFNNWCEQIWRQALLRGEVEPAYLLSDFQGQYYWRKVIEQSQSGAGLITVPAAARLAQQAYYAALEYQLDIASYQFEFQSGVDSAAFFEWQQAYRNMTAERGQLSLLEAQQQLLGTATLVQGQPVVAVGFDQFTPLQQALLTAANCQNQADIGDGVPELQLTAPVQSLYRSCCNDEEDELYQAAHWANAMQWQHPDKTVAVVVRDLAARAEQVERIFHEVCQPAVLQLENVPAERHVNVSASRPLNAIPMVRTVLNLTQAALQPLELARWRELLYSPYLAFQREVPGLSHALLTALYRAGEPGYRLQELPAVLRWSKAEQDDSLALLEKAAQAAARLQRDLKAGRRDRATPSQWLAVFEQLWSQLGWLTGISLSSVEFQQQRRFEQACAEFAELDLVIGDVPVFQALALFREHCAQYAFHSETIAPANLPNPVNVLGQLEASGLHFDFLWLVGMSARQWPPAARPQALLPVRLQREAGMHNSSQQQAFTQAQIRSRSFLSSASVVVASFPAELDETTCEFSGLLTALAQQQGSEFEVLPGLERDNREVLTHTQEEIADWQGLPLEDDGDDTAIKGGASVLAMHASNPLLAYLQWRLGIEALPEPVVGISALERGILVHQVLEALWGALGDRAGLLALTAEQLQEQITEHTDRQLATLFRRRYKAPAGPLLSLERDRTRQILGQWFELERSRPDFSLEAMEQSVSLSLGGLTISLRIDRIDRLADDRQLLIDYKTGSQTLTGLFGDPPLPLQLPLYCLALEQLGQFDPERIAIAYAVLKSGELGISGIAPNAHDALALEGMRGEKLWAKYGFDSWAELVASWRDSVTEQLCQIREADIALDPEAHGERNRAESAISRLPWSTVASLDEVDLPA